MNQMFIFSNAKNAGILKDKQMEPQIIKKKDKKN
jgi:hypothetical protein